MHFCLELLINTYAFEIDIIYTNEFPRNLTIMITCEKLQKWHLNNIWHQFIGFFFQRFACLGAA